MQGKHLCSPSLLAARFQSYEILEMLVLHGADIAAQDEQGRTICDFECEGQVAAAIQRGVVGRFNRTIRVARPLAHGAGAASSLRPPPPPQHHTSALQESPQSAAHSVASSTTPPGHSHYTPHPRKHAAPHSTAPIAPSTDGRAASSGRSPSRSPSPSGLPPIRVRKTRGAPGSAAASSAAAHHAAASSTASVASPSAAAAIASSRAFQHPLLASAELTDDALAAMEASVEQILHRRDPNAGSTRAAAQSSPNAAAASSGPSSSVSSRRDSGVGSGPAQQHRSSMPAQPSFGHPRSILKSSRLDSPARRGTPGDADQSCMVQVRSTSDNVHQEDLEDDSESHDDEAEREEIERRRRAAFAARALHQRQQPRPASAPHSAQHSEGEVVSGEDDEEDEEDEEDEVDEQRSSQDDDEEDENGENESLAPVPVVHRPPALTVKVGTGASPFKRALDEHLATQAPASPFVLTSTPPGGENSGSRAVSQSQSPAWTASAADPTPSPDVVAAPQSAEEVVVARELARLQAGLPMDATQIAQVAAHLSATAAIVGITVAPARGGSEEAAASPLPCALDPEEQHAPLAGLHVLEVRQPRRRGEGSDESASSIAGAAPAAPPKHVAALREAMAAAKEERTIADELAQDDDSAVAHSPAPATSSPAPAGDAASAPSSTEKRSDKSKRKPGRRRKALVEIAAPPPPQPARSPFSGASPSVSPPAAASLASAVAPPSRTPPFVPQLNPFQLTSATASASVSTSSSAKPSPTLRPSKAPSPSPSAPSSGRMAVAVPVQHSVVSVPTAAPISAAAAPTSAAAAAAAPATSASVGSSRPTSGATSSTSSVSASPHASPSGATAAAASRSRQDAERAVDAWLVEHDFDSVSRSSLAGFSFADLRSLEHGDCVELLGERVGPLLFLKLRNAPIPASLLRTPSPLIAAAAVSAQEPSVAHPPLSSWLEAAAHGVAVAAAKEAEELARSAHPSEAEDTEEDEEDEAEDDRKFHQAPLAPPSAQRSRGASASPVNLAPAAVSAVITSPVSAPVASTPQALSAPATGAAASITPSPVSASAASSFDSRARSSFGFLSDALRTSFVFQGAAAVDRSAAAAPVAAPTPSSRAPTTVALQVAPPVMLPPRPSAQAIHAVQGAVFGGGGGNSAATGARASPPPIANAASSAGASAAPSSSSDPSAVASQWLSSFEKSFTSVAGQLKHTLNAVGSSKKDAREEMRRTQPHRLRRQQQQQTGTEGASGSSSRGGAAEAPQPSRSGYERSWDQPSSDREAAAAQAALLGSQQQPAHKQQPAARSAKVPPPNDYMSAF